MKNLTIGSIIAFFGLWASNAMMGGTTVLYFHPAEMVGLILVPVGITISSFGFTRFLKAIHCIVSTKYFSRGSGAVLRRWISATYATGAVVCLIGFVLTLNVVDQGPMVLGSKFAASFSAPIYAIIISELFLRSTLARLNELVEVDG